MKALSQLALLLITFTHLAAQPAKSSLLWQISGNGLEKPSYLFGTFHIMCKGEFDISGELASKLKTTQQFYGEINLDEPDIQTKMISKLMLSGTTLQAMIPATDYQKINTGFQEITGMPMATFNSFKPFLCVSLLALKSITCNETVQPETEFVSVAKKNNLPILGLETIDDQINAIDREPLDSQISSLQKMILNFDSVKTVFNQLTAMYKTRNIDSIYLFMKSTGTSNDNFETELLVNRNRKWIPVIEKAIKEKSSFFAVGAGHLGGEQGMINLLRKKGFRLEPVMY